MTDYIEFESTNAGRVRFGIDEILKIGKSRVYTKGFYIYHVREEVADLIRLVFEGSPKGPFFYVR